MDELQENPFADAIILPVEFCVLVLFELLGVRDEKLSRSILRLLFVSVHQALELLSPTGFPVLSTIFSAWVFAENLL